MANIIENIKRSYQRDSYSCGAHALYSILRYYNKKLSFEKLKKELGTNTKNGTNLASILRFLKKKNFKFSIKRHAKLLDLKKAIDNKYPILILTDEEEHWVVVYGYSEKMFYVLDSTNYTCTGKSITKQRFKKCWDRFGIIVKGK